MPTDSSFVVEESCSVFSREVENISSLGFIVIGRGRNSAPGRARADMILALILAVPARSSPFL